MPIDETLINFIRTTLTNQRLERAVIAVSGGIDSAVALTLLVRALGTPAVTPLLMPYGDQDMTDARLVCDSNRFRPEELLTYDIKPLVDSLAALRGVPDQDRVRRGNIMARVRMILLFDTAKAQNALVCGTENKSEHYLGYFTRFGDGASDFEPLLGLYKTEVFALASQLQVPVAIQTKAPSANLWSNQTDEAELGFSYEQADQVLRALIDEHLPEAAISLPDIPPAVVKAVCDRVKSQAFKHAVPYTME